MKLNKLEFSFKNQIFHTNSLLNIYTNNYFQLIEKQISLPPLLSLWQFKYKSQLMKSIDFIFIGISHLKPNQNNFQLEFLQLESDLIPRYDTTVRALPFYIYKNQIQNKNIKSQNISFEMEIHHSTFPISEPEILEYINSFFNQNPVEFNL